MSIHTPQQQLATFRRALHKQPFLSHSEEAELATAWHNRQDPRARDTLLLAHAALVQKIAHRYRGYGLPLADLVAEGFIGMMHALHRFEPHRGFRFSTYAMWWIRASIQSHVMDMWSMVKIGKGQVSKKLFFGLRRAESQMTSESNTRGEALEAALSKKLEVTDDHIKTMRSRMNLRDFSLNATLNSDDGHGTAWQDRLVDENANHEEAILAHDELVKRRALLDHCLGTLSPREYKVLKARRLEETPRTLDQLAQEMALSKERVRQIEVKAFEKVRKEIKRRLIADSKPTKHARVNCASY